MVSITGVVVYGKHPWKSQRATLSHIEPKSVEFRPHQSWIVGNIEHGTNLLDPTQRPRIVFEVGSPNQFRFRPVFKISARSKVKDAPVVAPKRRIDFCERDIQTPAFIIVAGDHVSPGTNDLGAVSFPVQ